MKNRIAFYKSHFYQKMLILQFFGISFLMVLISFVSFYITFRYYVNTLSDYALQNSAHIRADLDSQLSDATLITDAMYLDSEIQDILYHPSRQNQARFQNHYHQQNFSNPYFIFQIDLFDLSGNRYVYYNSGALAHGFLSDPKAFSADWLPLAEEAGGRMLWVDGSEVSPSASHLLFAMRLIKNVNSNKPRGVAVVSVLKRDISDSMSRFASDTTHIYLTDTHGRIVIAQNPSKYLSGEPEQLLEMAMVREKEGYYTSFSDSVITIYSYDPHTHWYVVQETRMPTFFLFMKQLADAVPIILILAMATTALLSYSLYQALSRPILNLVENMRNLEVLDFTPPDLDTERPDEIGYLNRGYLLLLEHLHRLFDSLVKEQNAKKNAELQALRAQINPHFLYNTLTAVRFLIDMQQNQSASEVLIGLIKLLKVNLDPKYEMITVEEELEYLRNYIVIQKHRYDNFEISYDIGPDTRSCRIPRLLIQPLVENSLFHGFKNGGLPGHILICIHRMDPFLCVRVHDDGCGFSQAFNDQIPNINAQRNSVSIGLHNVNDRLRLRYGPGAALHIESAPGQGACVSFQIPIQEE